MYKKIKGIVLKRVPFAESSAYITVLTETGLEKFSAKGILSRRNKNSAACALWAYSEFILSCRQDNQTLSSVSLLKSLIRQGVDFEALAVANYVSSLAHDVTFNQEDAPAIYKLLGATLAEINKMKVSPALIKAVFELRLMSKLGFSPDIAICSHCSEPFEEGYFLPSEGVALCQNCSVFTEKEKVPLSHGTAIGINTLLSLSDSAAYGIRFSDKMSETRFESLCEKFSVNHLDCAFAALGYYKTNIKNLTDLT